MSEELASEDLNAEDLSAINGLPPNSALLIVGQGPAAGARFLVDSDVTTAGRHPRCDIFLDDITVSRNHARFTRRDGHDLGRGREQHERHVREPRAHRGPVALRRGDEVQIGKFRMLFFNHPG